MLVMDAFQYLDTIEIAALKPDIENQEVRPAFFHCIEGRLAVPRGPADIAFIAEDIRYQHPDILFVVDDKNISRHMRCRLPARRPTLFRQMQRPPLPRPESGAP